MIIAICMTLLAMIGAGATIVCSLMYFKKCDSTSKMSMKPSAKLGELRIANTVRGELVENVLTNELLFYQQMELTPQLMLS